MAYPDASASKPSAIHKQTAFRGMSFCLDKERQMIYMMANFIKYIHVTRKSLIASMKKAMSIVIVTMLMISLVGCGDSSDNTTAQTSGSKENRMTTEEEMSTQEEAGNPIDEPNQEIDEGVNLPSDIEEDDTEEPATEAADDSQPQGKYTYTIYDGVELSMDVNIDDYIVTNKLGDQFFNVYSLAEDLGWEGADLDSDGYASFFTYTTSAGPIVRLQIVGESEVPEGWEDYGYEKVTSLYLEFTNGAPDYSLYYKTGDTEGRPEHLSSAIHITANFDKAQYGIGGAFGEVISRDTAIMTAYLFWDSSVNDGESHVYESFTKAGYDASENVSSTYYVE